MEAIRLEKLFYAYPDGVPALREVSLAVASGEVLGLLGANGAGKSTLLLHLNGVLSGTGQVTVEGVLLSRRTVAEIRRRVGLVFQDPDDQLFMPRVWDDVAFGPQNLGWDAATVERKVAEALAVVGMSAFAQRAPHHLSLGEKKKVALATVLAMDSSILALDEPTAGLDPRARRELIRFLRDLPRTQILATHDLELAVELCHRVVVLSAGRVVADGPPAAIMGDQALMEGHGLEVPHSLRYHGADRHHPPARSAAGQTHVTRGPAP